MNGRGIGWAAGMLTRLSAVKTPLRQAVVDCLAGQPRAVDYDPSGKSRTPWCWTHERPVSACHRADLLCAGETIESHDPTGEAAVGHDPAAQALKDLDHLERQLVALVVRYDDIRRQYLPTQQELPTESQRAKLATAGEPGCHWCEQAGTWSPPHTKQPTNIGGILPEPRFVCANHYDLIRKRLLRAPTRAENEAFVHRGKWPKQRATT